MNIHILGICGTFMAGIAVLAQQKGFKVTGQDAHVYPPMSTQLEHQGIKLIEGYNSSDLPSNIDVVIIGNAMTRGNPVVEAVLNRRIPYYSGPQWLYENILKDRFVVAIAGTHGKTTTSSMVAWILEHAGLQPGFLIGGVPENFGVSARLGSSSFFVIEADEYDTAFFDKRSKFIHYRPTTAILNNLEFDHVDIFPDLAAIQKQFHHLVRTIPGNGLIIVPEKDTHLQETIGMGCWTPIQTFSLDSAGAANFTAKLIRPDASQFQVIEQGGQVQGEISWQLLGSHNVNNALAAILATRHAGVPVDIAVKALSEFKNVKRRLEVKGYINQITVYDDFAHHPTAIATTLAGLRAKVGQQRIIAVVDFASHTMRKGIHKDTIGAALKLADKAVFAKPQGVDWQIEQVAARMDTPTQVFDNVNDIINYVVKEASPFDHVLVMSNKGFDGLHNKLLAALEHHEGAQ